MVFYTLIVSLPFLICLVLMGTRAVFGTFLGDRSVLMRVHCFGVLGKIACLWGSFMIAESSC